MRGTAVTGASSRADRVNRTLLTLLGLILVGVGGYGLARSWGAFGDGSASAPLLLDSWRGFVAHQYYWFWPAAVVVSLLVGVVGLRWLRAQLAAARPEAIDLTHREDGGSTTVRPAGAARALAGDVEGYRGVNRASARLAGDPDAPEIDLRVEIADDCNLLALRSRIDEEALVRFRQALELDTLDVNVEFRLAAPAGRRLR